MLLHEKMRLQRKVNKLHLRQLKAMHREERVTKQIERVQKMYSAKMSRLDSTAKLLGNQYRNSLFNGYGLGVQNQAFNPYGGSSLTSFALGAAQKMLPNITKDDQQVLSEEKFQEILNKGGAYGGLQPIQESEEGENGATTTKTTGYGINGEVVCTEDEYNAFRGALSQAQQYQAMMQNQCQIQSDQYNQSLSIWLEAQKAQLEEEQDAALAPLEEQQTAWQLEKESVDTQLEIAKANLESIKQACSEGIKDSAPKFGLS